MRILRLVSLAILFGGSSSIVFGAITMVRAAVAQGVSRSEAATANSPLFLGFASVVLGAAILLLICEAVDFGLNKTRTRLTVSRYAASVLCISATFIFSLGIVPLMKEVLPDIKTSTEAREEFHKLHELSRGVFSGTILFALISLVLSGVEKNQITSSPAKPETSS